jgi:hypothetical protein
MAAGESSSSIFEGVKRSFAEGSGNVEKWILVFPIAYVLTAIIALLLGISAVGRRPGWLGLITLFSGMSSALGLVVWLGLSQQTGPALSFGFYLALLPSAVCLLLALIQLFAEGD